MLLRLPSTASNVDSLRQCADGINDWKAQLGRGLLPSAETPWPDDPVFREGAPDALGDLDMARFTRQFPPVLDTLMKNILDILYVYEQQKVDEEGEDAEPPSMQNDGGGSSDNGEDGDPEDGDPDGDGSGGGAEGDDQEGEGGSSPGGGGGQEGAATTATGTRRTSRTSRWGWTGRETRRTPRNKRRGRPRGRRIRSWWRNSWTISASSGNRRWISWIRRPRRSRAWTSTISRRVPEGSDVTKGLWQQETGWKELDSLRRKLEELRELRDLVRSLGRGAGRGPPSTGAAPTRATGHARGFGALSARTRGDERSVPQRRHLADATERDGAHRERIAVGETAALRGRTERTLLSYERVGWGGGTRGDHGWRRNSTLGECGPIILCLDTSGSMMGARETVAKAMVLECMRQAKSQQRQCYLYSFSGPGDCQELELKVSGKGVSALLEFLAGSFHGGTDVDEPFVRALARLEEAEWTNADILLVTDGEIRPPTRTCSPISTPRRRRWDSKCTDCSSENRARGAGRRRGAVHPHPHVQKLEQGERSQTQVNPTRAKERRGRPGRRETTNERDASPEKRGRKRQTVRTKTRPSTTANLDVVELPATL